MSTMSSTHALLSCTGASHVCFSLVSIACGGPFSSFTASARAAHSPQTLSGQHCVPSAQQEQLGDR